MKNKSFFKLIFFLIFFSKNIFSHCKFDNSLDFCLITTTLTLTHNCGYILHKNCILSFDQEDFFDVTCARTTGIITTAIVFNVAAGGSFFPEVLYTPIVAHNALKIVDKYLNPASSECNHDFQKPSVKKIQ